MSAYQNRDSMNGFLFGTSFTKYTASTSDSAIQAPENEHSTSVWEDIVEEEWSFDFGLSIIHFKNHFGLGFGFQFMNPYISLGAAFDHFGIMGWTDWRLIAVCAGEPDAFRGGISVMEQISPIIGFPTRMTIRNRIVVGMTIRTATGKRRSRTLESPITMVLSSMVAVLT